MEQFETFKEKLLNYLYIEKSMYEHDIEVIKQMSREMKIELDFMIENLSVSKSDKESYIFKTNNNYSKLRAGDKVVVKNE